MPFGTVLEAICNPPNPFSGIPMGEGNWRFSVEILTSTGGGRVGSARVGISKVSRLEWTDITADVTECMWSRGASATSQGLPRASIGTATITLKNSDQYYSAWNRSVDLYREWTTGALIRIVAHEPSLSFSSYSTSGGLTTITRDDWNPLFTGVVEAWDESISASDSIITITLAETMSVLAGVNKDGVSPVGAGDDILQRFDRLLTDADWKFGLQFTDTYSGPNAVHPTSTVWTDCTFQATSMAQNRLAEMYLTADSAILTPVISGKDGMVRWGLPQFGPVNSLHVISSDEVLGNLRSSSFHYLAEMSPPFTITNNSDFVVNDVGVTEAGGSQQNFSDLESQSKFGVRSYQRNDLINVESLITFYTGLWQTDTYSGIGGTQDYLKNDQTLQPGIVRIVNQFEFQRMADLYEYCQVDWNNFSNDVSTAIEIQFNGRIIGIQETVTPTRTGVVWESNYSVLANSSRRRVA